MSREGGFDRFGDVRIGWQYNQSDAACRVEAWWQGSLFLGKVLTNGDPTVHFSVETDYPGPIRRVRGDLRFHNTSRDNYTLVLNLKYPEGEVNDFFLWPSSGPEPPRPPAPPIEPPPEESAAIVGGESGEDLFPYVYLRSWPGASAEALNDRFVAYVSPDCALAASADLYCNLLAKRKTGREAMQGEAILFLQGRPPYDGGQFLRTIHHLRGPIRRFPGFDAWLRSHPETGLEGLKRELERLLEMTWTEIAAYLLADPAFASQFDQCWQNLFALTIIEGFDEALLLSVTRTVTAGRLLQRIATSLEPETEQPDAPILPWNERRIREGAWATVILPEALFPLPPGNPVRPAPLQAPIVPYAIGDLELVRQRLIRYEQGEISHIESVMRGEYKEITRRRMNRVDKVAEDEDVVSRTDATDLDGTHSDLAEETSKTLLGEFDLQFKTTYGPPKEAVAHGHLQLTPNKSNPTASYLESAAQVARNITAKTASQLARTVSRKRTLTQLREDEETSVTRFDRSAHADNTRGIYRWVNRVYKAWVVNYGHRLILEFLIPDPARAWISGAESLHGLALMEPLPLESLGVRTSSDIAPEETPETRERYYANLAARYGADDVVPPPPPFRSSAAVFQSGTDVRARQIVIPDGYIAQSATVTVMWDEKAVALETFGIVGQHRFSAVKPGTQTLVLSPETSSVPAMVACTSPTAEAPPGKLPPEPNYLASIGVQAARSPALLESWQLRTYNVLRNACRKQREDFYRASDSQSNASGAGRNPLADREAIRKSLRQDITQALLKSSSARTGTDSQVRVGEPRFLQFFQQAFEWNEMSYSLAVVTGDTRHSRADSRFSGDTGPFSAFLEAGLARVLLPVRPEYSFILPYFLASGTIWSGPNGLAPANVESIDLINELKRLASEPCHERTTSQPWEIRVPTSMVVLQDSPDLPEPE